MPQAQQQLQKSVAHILEAVMFENWLRFYFIAEGPDMRESADGHSSLVLRVSDKGMERIRADYSHLLPLAESLNGKDLDFEASRTAVCLFVTDHLDGTVMPKDSAAQVLASALFQDRLQLFNTWVQAHENVLDKTFLDFAAWRQLFAQWAESALKSTILVN
ncbi:MAG: conserved hypothetical protein [Candidatus Desulfovibrio kirbyi]|jgi:hypothetical protein|uniref:Uncharacterized protein n=1 Tax=Candidatus Desulfovibrio kirbyi TaxID=2696086 RepID=A0A6L2R5U7_9BACT|nr:hypothetical protein [Desulfovibrio sp.]GFH62909.1 MAG: conserved hypothetical protein [Candidatus Desulfovibrio kirbyi]